MNILEKKIGGYFAEFTFKEHELLINITHPSKSHMVFGRLTNDLFPGHLKEIADNILELVDVIRDLPDDKMVINQNSELVLVINLGKKVKQYAIGLEKAEMSNEEGLRKRVEELEKNQERLEFQVKFYREQYQFLMQHLVLKPEVPQLEKLYGRNLSEVLGEKQMKESKVSSSSSSISMKKVGSSKLSQEFRCPKDDPLRKQISSQAHLCNICMKTIPKGKKFLSCDRCDFDVCDDCLDIPPQHRKYCPELHILTFGCANHYEFRACDHCKKLLEEEKGYSCKRCDYDICKSCI